MYVPRLKRLIATLTAVYGGVMRLVKRRKIQQLLVLQENEVGTVGAMKMALKEIGLVSVATAVFGDANVS